MQESPRLNLLHQDPFVLVINKPSGIHSAINPRSQAPSVAAHLLERFPQSQLASKNPLDAGLINRLDFYTSGILLAALEQSCWKLLFEELQQGWIEKHYRAVVEGYAPTKVVIETMIGSPYRRAKKVRVYQPATKKVSRALPARSEMKRVSFYEQLNCSLVEIVVHCARRHQVRAHAAHIGHPLLGDHLYGSSRSYQSLLRQAPPGEPGEPPLFFLQAHQVSFRHPMTKESMLFSLPLPEQLCFLSNFVQTCG